MFTHCNTHEELKAEYRQLAMQHHPDKGGDPEMFMKMNLAMNQRLKEINADVPLDISEFLSPQVTEKLMTAGFQILDAAVLSLKEKVIRELTRRMI